MKKDLQTMVFMTLDDAIFVLVWNGKLIEQIQVAICRNMDMMHMIPCKK